ncbi:hypothetical protein ILUMI_07417 [Ignelater luminosus]|uniref:Sushi domain-containing protein n=1 Tax=Ignelater luminosus TaxID=2038154 RepID=A0A8K0D3I3_IGNLU|nr:hypothetical protein ILUMI_07417 [Ignelater luminosus]
MPIHIRELAYQRTSAFEVQSETNPFSIFYVFPGTSCEQLIKGNFLSIASGWAIASEERDWKYRLSIYYAKPQDSGTFTCATPRGITNSISLHVAAIHCGPISVSSMHLTVRVEGTRLGHTAIFQCPVYGRRKSEFAFNASERVRLRSMARWRYQHWRDLRRASYREHPNPITCLPLGVDTIFTDPFLVSKMLHLVWFEGAATWVLIIGRMNLRLLDRDVEIEKPEFYWDWIFLIIRIGKWSSSVPTCEPVRCPSLSAPGGLDEPHLKLVEHNSSYGGRAVFSCAWGYQLVGPPGVECELDGNWSGPLPKCVPIQCSPPVIPVNGHLIQSESAGMDGGRYAVGSLVQFACRGSHILEGEPSIICTETGYWSHPPPFCKPQCPYLGEPQNGAVAPSKFAYEPGDELQVTCNPGFEARLEARPKCLSDGRWSMPLPQCTNYSQI